MDLQSRPRLRVTLDIQPITAAGESYVILRDRSQVAEQPAVYPLALYPIVARFDGAQSIEEIAAEGAEYGITPALVLMLAEELESLLLLESAAVELRRVEIAKAYGERSEREAVFAGRIYPTEPEELRRVIDQHLENTRFPAGAKIPEDICALICPHIDYERGWHSYGVTFHILEKAKPPDVIFLMGTSHQAGSQPFIFTKKHFAVPGRTFSCDLEIVDALAKRYGNVRAFSEEVLHRTEHSLELQLPFVAHRFQRENSPTIVPILIGSFYDALIEGRTPREIPAIGDFIDSCAEILSNTLRSGKRVWFYGGIDLAHVGMHFGDAEKVSDRGLDALRERDHELLQCVLAGDEEGLFSHIAEDGDARRICGFPTLYTMLSVLKRAGIVPRGTLFEYRQAVDEASDCIVSFASAAWENVA